MSDFSVKERGDPRKVSRTSSGYEKSREYLVCGPTTPEGALSASYGPDYLPDIGDEYAGYNMVCSRLEAEQLPDDPTRWTVRAIYRPKNRTDYEPQGGGQQASTSYQFATQSGTKHITQALTVTPASKTFTSGDTKIPSNGIIGWDGQKVQGVDIPFNTFGFSVAARYATEEMNLDMLNALIRGGVDEDGPFINDAEWGPYAAGELLLDSISGRYSSGGSPVIGGDDIGQFGGMAGIFGLSKINTTNGMLFITLEKYSGLGNCRVRFYKNAARTILVASNDFALVGTNDLTEANGSGIYGTFILYQYVYDTSTVTVQFPLPWEIQYAFKVSPNSTTKEIAGITVTNKKGWELADVRYRGDKTTVETKEMIVQKGNMVYLHEVLPEMDFGLIPLNPTTDLPPRATV